jgi:DNA helicase HerA-like ATPase
MDTDTSRLYRLIKEWKLDWRHPELNRIVQKIEKGRMRPQQSRRWLKKIRPWVEAQQKCFNPFPPAPEQETLGKFDIEVGKLKERSDVVRVGLRITDRPRHALISGTTGSGKSNVLKRIILGLDSINRNSGRIHNDTRP